MVPSLILAATLTLAAIPHSHEPSAELNDGNVVSELVLRCEAEVPGKLDWEAAEMLAELLGAPVFAAGGREIGNVADISFDEEGRAKRLLVTTEANLGFGTRTVNIPIGTFIVLRGAVVLDLTPEQVRRLPDDRCYKLR
jgi:sporulation protein YlmC with PRC-barrel domain